MATANDQRKRVVQARARSRPHPATLDSDEAIRCLNYTHSSGVDESGDKLPDVSEGEFEPYEWYYALDRGELALYHCENYFRPNTAITETQAEVVICSAPVAERVDRAELVAAQKRVRRE